MFTVSISVPHDVLQAGGGAVQVAMYGQLLAPYTPTSGPSANTSLAANQWVYYTGTDYAAAAAPLPAFATYTAAGTQTLTLPNVQVQAAHVVFGLGTLPAITLDSSGAPQQPDPVTTTGIYDFVEFTYNLADTLYLNTTMIDQFGIPIQIQIDPASAMLPSGAGVTAPRSSVFSQYRQYATGSNAAFLQCAQDAFGNPLTTRLLSPKNTLVGNSPQGVQANVFTGPVSTLAAGSYYYAVTAVNAKGVESFAQNNVVAATITALGQAVNVAWSPNTSQPAGTASYNLYRGTGSGTVTWGLIGNAAASDFKFGGALQDTGQASTDRSPPMNPLATWFDAEIKAFFAAYRNASAPLVLTATDGTTDGYVYAFNGVTTTDASGSACLQLTLTAVTSAGAAVADPPIPVGTPFNIYYPYWNTNTFDSTNPAPPSWTVYPADTASVMVLAAEGVFADNAQQSLTVSAGGNLPSQVPAASAGLYSTLLGALENQVVAALTRGIANSAAISPQNWGNGTEVVQLPPTPVAGKSTLVAGTTYYYVVTAVNANGETIASLEFTATPTAGEPCVQVNWQPVSTVAARSFNVYRGTAAQQENVLAGSIQNSGTTSSFVDTGATAAAQSPPVYFPSGGTWSAYDAFFHQPSISLNGAAYAGPYDDQGGQSSTLATGSPVSASITLGAW